MIQLGEKMSQGDGSLVPLCGIGQDQFQLKLLKLHSCEAELTKEKKTKLFLIAEIFGILIWVKEKV